jgi:rubrerythrin
MHEMTRQNLLAAFAGESQAHMKYLAFAERAERDGRPEVARLLRAIAYAEQVHATNHLKALDGIADTAANVAAARGGEGFEITEMYPAYLAVATVQEEARAKRSMEWALVAERIHADLYDQAAAALAAGADLAAEKTWVCEACGHTHRAGEPPDRCPVCGAKKEKYRGF